MLNRWSVGASCMAGRVSVFLFVCALILLTGCEGKKENPLIGTTVDALTVRWLDGKDETIVFPTTTPVLLEFWEPWCPGCIKNIPEMNRICQHFGDTLRCLGLVFNGTFEQMTEVLGNRQMQYSCGVAGSKLGRTLQVNAIPSTFVLNRQGTVMYHHLGTMKSQKMVKEIEKLLSSGDAR